MSLCLKEKERQKERQQCLKKHTHIARRDINNPADNISVQKSRYNLNSGAAINYDNRQLVWRKVHTENLICSRPIYINYNSDVDFGDWVFIHAVYQISTGIGAVTFELLNAHIRALSHGTPSPPRHLALDHLVHSVKDSFIWCHPMHTDPLLLFRFVLYVMHHSVRKHSRATRR